VGHSRAHRGDVRPCRRAALAERETARFDYASIDQAVRSYATQFGPFVAARALLEADGRWDAFLAAFADLVARFSRTTAGGTRIEAEYLVITVEPGSMRRGR
jgi:hypothetical protein